MSAEEIDALLREMEEVVFETLPPAQAEAALEALLKQMLMMIEGEMIRDTERLPERPIHRGYVN